MKYSKQNTYCATCDYWNGNRSVDNQWSINQVITESATERGVCGCRDSGRWNVNIQGCSICSSWEIWSRLRN